MWNSVGNPLSAKACSINDKPNQNPDVLNINTSSSIGHEELRRLVRVEPITTFIRSGRLRWCGHVMRPRRAWLESVEAYIAELEIDKEDVHDRKKWRRNVMKRKSNPIGKRDYKPIIYIYI